MVTMPFKPRAQMLLQLGEQLIKNENIAVLELVKNSYDADATEAKVIMTDVDQPLSGYIEIIDNGYGMNLDVIRNIWMEPGNSHKREIVNKNERTPLGRLPIGEKGIGRFGVHKLGKRIELISKTKNDKEVVLKIDWNKFESAEYLSDVNIDVAEREPEYFTDGKTGTYMRIDNLSKAWTRGMMRSLYRSLTTLNSPFDSNKSFSVKLKTNRREWLEGILKFEDIKKYALFEGEIELSGDQMVAFDYEFKPYDIMNDLKPRTIHFTEPVLMKREERENGEKKLNSINLNDYQIGNIKIKIYAFDRDATLINKYIPEKTSFKNYLNENGGFYVFRDGMRILDYGEAGNDWLELDSKRVNRPAHFLSNNIVLGAVYLQRNSSISLKEKANREGFIEDAAYFCFRNAVEFAVGQFTAQRNIDKDNMRKIANGGAKEPVKETVSEIRKLVRNSNIEANVKKQLEESLFKVEQEFEYLKERYVRTANAGLSYGIVIHEIEKIIGELKLAVKEEEASKRVQSLALRLSLLIDSYAELLRNRHKEKSDLKSIIKQALFSIEYRLSAHEIEVIDYSEKYIDDAEVNCASNMIIGAIINVLDNSIYWTTYSKVPKRKIFVSISNEIDGFIGIVIADNGTGYKLAGDDAIKPFVSLKDNGLGLGLNIVNEIMLSQGGMISFPEYGDIAIPEEFKNGAITVLAFKKEK